MSTFAPTTKAQLQTAITAWISNSTTATTTYGIINTWNVTAITDMSSLFANKTTFNGNISSWNVSQVTTMSSMFSGASAFNQSLNAWNVSSVSNMDSMFSGSAYNQPLNSWNVSNVTNMNSMFNGSPFNQPLNLWNVSKVTNMNNMFKTNTAFNQPIDSWNVSSVTRMTYMFGAASTFNQSLNSWNVSNVTDMTYMFGYASAFNGNISAWNVSKLQSMQQMFEGAVAFNGNISAWNTMSNNWMNLTFKGATLFNQDISSWNVSKVQSMDSTFMNAPAFNQNIRKWYVASVLSFTTMFTGATKMLTATPTGQGATATPTAAYFNQVPANSAPVGLPTISGTAMQYKTLTAVTTGITDADGLGVFSYVWKRGATTISGATSATYPLITADVGQTITVTVSYLDGHGTTQTLTSAPTATVVLHVNTPPTGSITITAGTPSQNQTLSLLTNTIADVDGLGVIAWQWKSNGVDISGATGTTYVLTQGEVGKTITLTATYTDVLGTTQSVTSAATAAVDNAYDSPTGSITISGTAERGQTLTLASNTLADLDGMGAITWQWKSDGVAISGAADTTYVLTQAEVGKTITLTASYTDSFGAESVTSAATVPVTIHPNTLPTGLITITDGTPSQNQTLSLLTNTLADVDGLGVIAWQWKSNGSNITGATGTSYVLTQADVGKTITLTASYTDGYGINESVTSNTTPAVLNVNDLPTGQVIPVINIAGPAQRGKILTANTSGIEDMDGLGTFSYQWMRNNVDINGKTGSTYELIMADVGQYISVRVSYTDGQNTRENITSPQVGPIVNKPNNLPTGSITITAGTPSQNQTLSLLTNTLADVDGLSAFTWQWKSNGSNISGATGTTYVLTQAEVGKTITLTASYTDLEFNNESVTSAATAAVVNVPDDPVGRPVIAGTRTQGFTLTADTSGISDLDGLGVFSYQWTRMPDFVNSGVQVQSGSSNTYTLTQADVGKYMKVSAVYTDGYGATNSAESNVTLETMVLNVNDAPTGAVTIAGTVKQGFTLTASNNLVDPDGPGGAVSYAWKRNGISIVGANSSTYILTELDVDSKMSVVASYTDGGGYPTNIVSAETIAVVNVNDPLIGSVSITPLTPSQGQTLTAVLSTPFTDADGLTTVSYQWKRGGVAISGATASTYTLVQADVNSVITVTASYTDGHGTFESVTSAATTAVTNVNDLPTGSVTISGTPTQYQTLTAITTGLSDLDGLGAFSYQWMSRVDTTTTDISGATASTYALTQADVGKYFSVKVSYTDVLGALENVTSAETTAVANVNDSPTGAVTISGDFTQNAVLTAVTNGALPLGDLDGLGALSYQWKSNGVAIPSATGSTYTLTQADVGKTITVTVSYNDVFGAPESVTSAATTAIANVDDLATGRAVLTGTRKQGFTLTANISGIVDLDGINSPFSYKFTRISNKSFPSPVQVQWTSSNTYTLTQTEVGRYMQVTFYYIDAISGLSQSVTSNLSLESAVQNTNDDPSGTVTITGLAKQGETLTASSSLSDLDGTIGTVSYEWKRNGVAIASGTTYTLVDADVDTYITVSAWYYDSAGYFNSKLSDATAAVENVNDVLNGSVSITPSTGFRLQGQTLTAVLSTPFTDGDGPATLVVSYQWKRGGVDISGATASTYTLVQADVGSVITVTASYMDGHGTPESVTSDATTVVFNLNDRPTGSVSITPLTPSQGQTLTAITSLSDLDGLGEFRYQWMCRVDTTTTDISGATASTYPLTEADVGKYFSVKVSYTDGFDAEESVTSAETAAVLNVNDLPSGSVIISGDPIEKNLLTASLSAGFKDADGMVGATVEWQWKRNGVDINLATSSTYLLDQLDVGKAITVTASYMDDHDTLERVTSLPTTAITNVNDLPGGSVTIDGIKKQGYTLTASHTLTDVDGLPTVFRYQWMRNGSNINLLATGSTYILTQDDVDKAISVKVSYMDAYNAEESVTSDATTLIENVNDLPGGSVTISGIPAQREVLTASNTLSDVDGLGDITYQWNRDLIPIFDATGTTYTLIEADVGKYITVTASYTDVYLKRESKTSSSTFSIGNWNDPLNGSVSISGTAEQKQTLTAVLSTPFTDGDGPATLAVSYQWKRNGVEISGATASTYLLDQADVGKAITVTASYTDGHATRESVTSLPTPAVTNVNDLPEGSVSITGTAEQGQTLTASLSAGFKDVDGMVGAPVTWQWKRSLSSTVAGSNISLNATSSTYSLVQADVGYYISVTASYTDNYSRLESVTSLATDIVTNVNDLPGGDVTITGTKKQGFTLTASHTLTDDADGAVGPVSYQWNRNGVPIAIGTTYTLVEADVDQTITVTATYSDGVYSNSKTSLATAPIANENDALNGSVSISGTKKQGFTLTALLSDPFTDDDGMRPVSYQWKRNDVDISGAIASTYLLLQADVGKAITVTASYTDGHDTRESVTSAATTPIENVNDLPEGSLIITPLTPSQGQTLSIATNSIKDDDGLNTITWQWKSDGINIDGATGTTYVLTQAEVGKIITLTASYRDVLGADESVTSNATAAVANVNDLPTGYVILNGTRKQGFTLTADISGVGDLDGKLQPFIYKFNRRATLGSGTTTAQHSTSNTYILTQADVGKYMDVIFTYKDAISGLTETATSNILIETSVVNVNDLPEGLLIITPLTPSQGQTLSIATNSIKDDDGLNTITWQWKSNGINIDGATGTTYVLTQAEVGKIITLTASYTDLQDTNEIVTSNATAAVANVNDLPEGSITIAPLTPSQGQTLTLVENNITDIDGLNTIKWQWKSDGVAISGATGTTYVLTQAEVGKIITLTASYTDLQNTNESVTSNATAAVANVNDSLVGHVMIDGDLTHGQTLTASHTFTDVDGFSSAVSYQWFKNGYIINGAVNPTYTLTPDDIDAKFSVTASYTDGHETRESKTSAETFKIQPIRAAYSLRTKGIETMSLRAPVNGKIIIADAAELVVTSSNNAGALSAMTSVEKHAWIKQNASALLTKYTSSLGSNKLYVSKSLLPFAATSLLTDKVELIDAKSSSVASPLMRVRDASMGAFYMDTQPGNSVTLTYSPDTIVITHTSESAFTVAINGAAAVNKSIGDKILLKNVILTLGSITGEPNNLPVFVQNAPTTVFEDASYSYTVSVSDLDNDTFTVTAPILPSWLTFNQATGTLSCPSVPSAVVGSHAVQLLAEDIWNGKTYYDFTITVQNVLVTGTVTSSASLKYSDLNTVQTPILKAIQVSESDATVIINNATVNGVDVRSYLQLGAGPSNYTVTVKSGQHAALLTLLRTNPGNLSVAIKVTDISAQTSPIYVIETITVLNDSPTTTQQFPSSMTIIEDSSTAYAQSGGADSVITFSEACSVVLNGTYKDYFMLVATDGTSRTYKLKCKDLASARAIIPGTNYSLTVTATSSANALTVTSNSLSVQTTNILTTAIVGGAKILTHASLQAYITSSAAIPNIATIALSESDPQSITLQTVTVNGSSVDKTYFTLSGSAGNYVLSVNTSAASQLLTRLSALITSSGAYNMLMTFQVVEQGGNAFTQTITVAASNNIIKVSLKSTVTNVPNMVSYSVSGSVATVAMNYSATPVIDYVDYIISDANSAVGTRVVGGGIAYDGTTLPTMYAGVTLVKSMVYQSPGEWIVTYYESYSGITGSQSNTLTLKFSVRGAINFVLPALNASFELLQALSIVGNYDVPAPFALPTITLPMSASLFNDGLFHLELVDSNIHTLLDSATEAVYFSEQIRYYADDAKFPELKSNGNKYLRELPVMNGSASASTHLRQRNADVDGLAASMVHELAYQLTGVSLMDDQLDNGVSLRTVIDNYITTALPAALKSKIAACNGKTQNISGASDSEGRDNVPRELFMQIVESVVGDRHGTHHAKSSRLKTLFHSSNFAGGKYGIKFIAGDTLRFTVTISPSANPVDYIVDGKPHDVQEARTVEVIITMM